MYYTRTKRAVARLVAVLLTVTALVGGVTYAALASQPGLIRNNTISTAVANLQLSMNGSNYTNTLEGFNFADVVPGSPPSTIKANSFYMRNNGTTPLNVNVSIADTITNGNNVDLTKVHLHLRPVDGSAPQDYTFAELIAANSTGGVSLSSNARLGSSQQQTYVILVSMDADAVSSPSASIGNINISFGAVAAN